MPIYDMEEMEPEIDIKDMIFHILYHWRSILLVALVCMVGLAFWQNYAVDSVHAAGKKTEEEEAWEISVRDYNNNLSSLTRTIASQSKRIEEQQAYLKDSLWLNLNEDTEWVARKRWYIQPLQEVEGSQFDPADALVGAYQVQLNACLLDEEIKTILEAASTDYVMEVCSVAADYNGNFVSVEVHADSQEKVEKVLSKLAESMETELEPKLQQIGEHQRVLMEDTLQQGTKNLTRAYDGKMVSRSDEIVLRQENISKWQQEISTAQTTLNGLLRDEEPVAPGKHVIRYAAIGLVVGGILMVILWAVVYVLGGKLHSGEDMTLLFQAGIVGILAHSRARRPGKGIDKWIENLEFRHMEQDAGQIYDNAAALIRKNAPAGKLLLTGTLGTEKINQVAKELSARLGDTSLETAPDFLHNSKAIENLTEDDYILLVEEKEVTRTKDLERVSEMLRIAGIQAKGCLML